MVNMDTNEKLSPPYGSISRLKYVFDLFSTHNFPQVTTTFLRSRGFSGTDAFQTIAALKFLGIIDMEGNRTTKMTGLQLKGEEKMTSIQEIIKNAYSKLFETVSEPHKLPKDDLHNDFVSIYGLSGRLASTAVPNFLWLCKEAGLEVSDAPAVKERKPRTNSISQESKHTVKSAQKFVGSSFQPHSGKTDAVEIGEFKLVLPDDWDLNKTRQAVVKGMFSTIYDELTKLSTTLKKEQSDLGEE